MSKYGETRVQYQLQKHVHLLQYQRKSWYRTLKNVLSLKRQDSTVANVLESTPQLQTNLPKSKTQLASK
jgi:endonuclease/exonuclease/phosphatase (EEP) superfamily protein YafD